MKLSNAPLPSLVYLGWREEAATTAGAEVSLGVTALALLPRLAGLDRPLLDGGLWTNKSSSAASHLNVNQCCKFGS